MKRETKKIVEIQGRKFEIRSFDAFTGSYIAFTLMEKMLPMGMEAKVMNTLRAEGKDVDALPTPNRALMSKGEFIAFQRFFRDVPRRSSTITAAGEWRTSQTTRCSSFC